MVRMSISFTKDYAGIEHQHWHTFLKEVSHLQFSLIFGIAVVQAFTEQIVLNVLGAKLSFWRNAHGSNGAGMNYSFDIGFLSGFEYVACAQNIDAELALHILFCIRNRPAR